MGPDGSLWGVWGEMEESEIRTPNIDTDITITMATLVFFVVQIAEFVVRLPNSKPTYFFHYQLKGYGHSSSTQSIQAWKPGFVHTCRFGGPRDPTDVLESHLFLDRARCLQRSYNCQGYKRSYGIRYLDIVG